jgi:hypothetical protein
MKKNLAKMNHIIYLEKMFELSVMTKKLKDWTRLPMDTN